MKVVFSVFLLVIASFATARGEVFTGEKSDVPFTVHGRLRNYMGYAQMRIWIVGSTRILGVEVDTPASEKIAALFPKGGWFDYAVYGDFTVEPLARDIEGHKRPVRILAVRNLVVQRDSDNAITLLRREL